MALGRPPIYSDPGQIEADIQEYFAQDGKKTITGLAYHLGFESRQSFYDYEQKGDFSYTIKRARLKIEMMYEEKLVDGNPAGPIFALKNFNWSDKTQIEHSGELGIIWNEEKVYDNKNLDNS